MRAAATSWASSTPPTAPSAPTNSRARGTWRPACSSASTPTPASPPPSTHSSQGRPPSARPGGRRRRRRASRTPPGDVMSAAPREVAARGTARSGAPSADQQGERLLDGGDPLHLERVGTPGTRFERGTIALVNPRAAASREARLEPADRADLAGEPDLAQHDHVGRHRPVGELDAAATAIAEVGSRLVERAPPATLTKTSWLWSGNPPASRGPPAAGRPGCSRRRAPCGAACRTAPGATSAWSSTSSGRVPSSAATITEPGAPAGPLGEEDAPTGSATSRSPRPSSRRRRSRWSSRSGSSPRAARGRSRARSPSK